MLKLTLNIGAKRNDGREDVTVAAARRALLGSGFGVKSIALHPDPIEDTIVAVIVDDMPFHTFSVRNRIYRVAEWLNQDCIAAVVMRHSTNMCIYDTGVLIGPAALKWGAFDPQFFKEALCEATQKSTV